MFTLILLLIFVGVAAGCWFQGLWSCAINLINLIFAGILATNFWEPICVMLEENAGKEYTFVFDILALWILFSIVYALLRAITNSLSPHRVEFHPYVEIGGRSVLALMCGWIFLCFTTFTLQTAPIPASPFGAWSSPESAAFLGFEPDMQWAAFAQNRSRFAYSRTRAADATTNPHPNDAEANVEAFDPQADFAARYHDRRTKFENMQSF
jgi:Colicin V production protein